MGIKLPGFFFCGGGQSNHLFIYCGKLSHLPATRKICPMAKCPIWHGMRFGDGRRSDLLLHITVVQLVIPLHLS